MGVEPGGHGAPGIADNIGGLLPGTYTVELTRSGYKDWNKQVTIVAGKTTVLYSYLESGSGTSTTRNEIITPDSTALYGSLQVNCSQYDANVYVGGEPGGSGAPGIADNIGGLLPGTYTVELTRSGYKDWTGQVTINTGQTTTINVTMVKNSS